MNADLAPTLEPNFVRSSKRFSFATSIEMARMSVAKE